MKTLQLIVSSFFFLAIMGMAWQGIAARGVITDLHPPGKGTGSHGVGIIQDDDTGDFFIYKRNEFTAELGVGDAIFYTLDCHGKHLKSCFAVDVELRDDEAPCIPSPSTKCD